MVKNTICLFASLLAVFAHVDPVQAQVRQVISGPGANTCGSYLEARSANDSVNNNLLSSWIQGFLSGANVERARVKLKMNAIPDASSLLAYADKYCRNSPLKSLTQAVIQLDGELERE